MSPGSLLNQIFLVIEDKKFVKKNLQTLLMAPRDWKHVWFGATLLWPQWEKNIRQGVWVLRIILLLFSVTEDLGMAEYFDVKGVGYITYS